MLGKDDLCNESLGTKTFQFQFPLISDLLKHMIIEIAIAWYELLTTKKNTYFLLRVTEFSYGLGFQSHLLEIDLSSIVYPL